MKRLLLLFILLIGNVCYSANWVEFMENGYVDYDTLKEVNVVRYTSTGANTISKCAYNMWIKVNKDHQLFNYSTKYVEDNGKDWEQYSDLYYYSKNLMFNVTIDYTNRTFKVEKMCFDTDYCEDIGIKEDIVPDSLLEEIAYKKIFPLLCDIGKKEVKEQPKQQQKTNGAVEVMKVLIGVPLTILGIIL